MSSIIHAVLVKSIRRQSAADEQSFQSGPLYYYQGYHDVVSVFLLTLGENLGFYCSDATSRFFIRDNLLENFEPGVIPSLKLLMQILKRVDPSVFEMLSIAGDVPTFSLSWLLTWFSHDLNEFGIVQRIFDACLSQHPLFPLYLVVAQILEQQDTLYEEFDEDDPHTSLYMIFQKIKPTKENFDADRIIEEACTLMKKWTPE